MSIGVLGKLLGQTSRGLKQILGHFRDRDFWIVQAGVIAVAGLHLTSEFLSQNNPAYRSSAFHDIPVILFILPIAYASIRYRWEGGGMTSLWVTVLTAPNLFLWHRENFAWLGELGRLAVIVGVALALAYRAAVETELRRQAQASETKFRSLFEAAADGILVYSRHGLIVAANPAAARLLGTADSSSLLGLDIGSLVPIWKGSNGLPVQQANPIDGPQRVVIRRQDGHKLMADAVIAGLPNGDGSEAFQAVLRDATEQDTREKGLRALVQQVTQAQEDERERIARELHDETLQALFLLAREQKSIAGSPEATGSLKERLGRLADLATDAAEGLRRFSRDLRPSVLNDLGLIPALEWLSSDLSRRMQLEARFHTEGAPRRLHPHVEMAIFRIAQEGLRNVEKYAHGTRVDVTVRFETSRVLISIADNGVGFVVPKRLEEVVVTGKLGLVGLKERAVLLGGVLEVESAPGKGTRVSATIPA